METFGQRVVRESIVVNKSAAYPAIMLLCIIALLPLFSCAVSSTVVELKREQLFSIQYGVLEDQLNLFNLEGNSPALKTRIDMRDGIFFVSNGNAGKILILSSFGDLLSMVYNPDRNPAPLLLGNPDGSSKARSAKAHPLLAPGEIAVDSKRTILVEDRVPESRRSYDDELKASLEYVILRFSREGEYMDYLGQEGLGGTAFPRLTSLSIDDNDDCIVICLSGKGWSIFRFDNKGSLLSSLFLGREDLPRPPEEKDSIASLDKILPVKNGRSLIVKIDYYKEVIEPDTHTQAGIEFSSSWIWFMDGINGIYTERQELPSFESLKDSSKDEPAVVRSWELFGIAGDTVYLSAIDEDNSYYGLYDIKSKTTKRYSVRIDPDETLYTAFSLSPEGILSGLLASRYEARFVWWRFDRMLKGISK